MKKLQIKKFDRGFYPNQDFDDVPDGGSPDCRHVFWRRSALRPFPGMDRVNSSQVAQLTGQGLHYMNVNGVQKRVAVFGTKFYEDVSGTWTDRTGAVVIGSGDLTQFIDHQQGANKYLIGFPGNGNPPFKWTGAGNAAVLAGSPPNGETGAKYHNLVYTAVNEIVYFSDTGDPETWDLTNWAVPFEKDVKCLLEHGPKLAVLMEDHIGSLQGYDYLDLVAEEREISTFGCVGKLAAKNCYFGNNDLKVIATIARDGVWIFDESFSGTKLLGNNYFDEFNQSYLSKSSMAYWRDENLLFLAIPYASSTQPNYLIIIDMKSGAFWPGPEIHGNYIRSLASMRDSNGDEFVYFQDANGYAYKFNMDTTYYHTGTATQGIDYRWKSRRLDLEDVHSLGELVMLADATGDWGVNVGLKFGLEKGDGTTGNINFWNDNDVLTYSFVLGASTLGGSDYIFKVLSGVGGFGRFLEVTLLRERPDEVVDQNFRVRRLEIHLHDHRRGGDDQ